MKAVFYEIEGWEADYIRTKLSGVDVEFRAQEFGPDSLPEDADILSPFVGCRVTKEVLEAMPSLKFITTRSTGYDHINVEAAKAHGIVTSNVPTYGENTVAEYTFALLLDLSRRIYPAIKRVREQGWFSSQGLRGFDLKAKTLGVIGTGHIGANVVQIARGFDMHVVAYDPYPNEALAKKYDFAYVSLEDLLRASDVVTLHVPYLPATHHLLNHENMKLMKPGSVLVNTARGGLIDTEALVALLHSGQLAGAALDVLEEEGYISDEAELLAHGHPKEQQMRALLAAHTIAQMDNVVLTPHNAFNTQEAIRRILDTTAENIQAFISGKPINVVKK